VPSPRGEGRHLDGETAINDRDAPAPRDRPPTDGPWPDTPCDDSGLGIDPDDPPWWIDCDDIILVDEPEADDSGGHRIDDPDDHDGGPAAPVSSGSPDSPPPMRGGALTGSADWMPEPPAPDGGEFADGDPDAAAGALERDPPLADDLDERPVRGAARARRRRRRKRDGSQAMAPTRASRRRERTPAEKLMILRAWWSTDLAATDFANVADVGPSSLYTWNRQFEEDGPAGLENKPKGGKRGSRLPKPTKHAILMLKQRYPDWGVDKLAAMLQRSEGYKASPGAVQRVLEEEGYVVQPRPTRRHPPQVRRFERSRPNELWMTDIFTFTLPRQNRRVHLVGYLDDHSRFILGFGLHATASGAMVRETLEKCLGLWGCPGELLTDNGAQYHTWRGKSAFRKLCERRGIKQIVSSPRNPRCLGKIERFWKSLWAECLEGALLRDLDDARERINLYVAHYNFVRPHAGIENLVPADRFFEAAPEVKATLAAQVDANALTLARNGVPRKPVYITGCVGDQGLVSVHAEGDRVILTGPDGKREEVDLKATGRRTHRTPSASPPSTTGAESSPTMTSDPLAPDLPPPGTSPLDAGLAAIDRLERDGGGGVPPDRPDDDPPGEPEG
jgi:transposase InsO family protein